ncbi:interleukin-12 receptor subunit beta-2-like [Varanus komodoensis]|uniref:interleukin-12 receptor subunit beta-2-like n=1 Tax=Varanus komodoensis TaxID=61221 RepID=UPI001CF7E2A3|nr:interleukin-12 receptor subunit beta-2-like [Varanus komodoensis]
MFFTGKVSLKLWLLVQLGSGVMFGRAEECHDTQGTMNATGVYMSRGSAVTLSCWLNSGGQCSLQGMHKISILQNHSEISSSSGLSVSAHISLHRFGRQIFECQCPKERTSLLICGIYIYVGIPPDQPKNISCIQYGKNGYTTCSWDKGHYTYLDTSYMLQVTNGFTNKTFLQEDIFTRSSIELKEKLDFNSTYTLVVTATNGLGESASQPFQFKLIDIVPLEPIDVWYSKEDVSSHMQNITLFWKAMSTSERRKSYNYSVIFHALNQKHHRLVETDFTTYTIFSRVTLKTDYNITVHSCNSRGISPPISITTKLEITDLPPPSQLSAVSMGNSSITVAWKAPLASSSFINGYVVEWEEFHQRNHSKSHPTWTKVPAFNFTVILDNLKPNVCYYISIFAIYQNRAGRAVSTTENVSAKAPLTGPHINATVKGESILVSWEEISDNQQMGCIVNYKIYLQNRFFTVPPKIYDLSARDPQPFPVESIQPGTAYAIWMTASTMAGESPKGNEEVVYIKNIHNWHPVLVIVIIVGLSACVCCVPSARQKIFSLPFLLLFGRYGKAVPDPANSSWAKEFTSVKDEPSLYSSQFFTNQSSFEEPQTLQIEEVFIKRQYPAFGDAPILKTTEQGEMNTCLTTCSLLAGNPTVKCLDYEPLITSTPADTDKQQFLPLYRKIAAEESHQGQACSEYLANPQVDAAIDYLPTIIPTLMDSDENSTESELSSLSVFPRTSFLPQTFSFGGKLTLDAVRMDCNSFTD